MKYSVVNNSIVFPEKGIRGLQLIGILPLAIGAISTAKLINELEYSEPIDIALCMTITLLGAFFITFKTSAVISKTEITKSWHAFFVTLRTKTIPISNFDTIFIQQESFTHGRGETTGESSVSYHITLANSQRYSLETKLITPEIYKYIYHLNQHITFNCKTKDALQRCLSLTRELIDITSLPTVMDKVVNKETTKITAV